MDKDVVFRLAKKPDIDEVFHVMEQVNESIANREWFVAGDRDYMGRHIEGEDGFTVAAVAADGRIAAFFTIDCPGAREDNLGYDIGLTEEECLHTAHMDMVGVLPAFRGKHLMARMLEMAESVLSQDGYRHLMCTVHPDNRHSLDIMTSHGYQIMATKQKYGGLLRHVLYKNNVNAKRAEGDGEADGSKPVILVSACLLGVNCRYDGKGVLDEAVKALMEYAVLIPVCPEIMGGLATPRDPAERVGEMVLTKNGEDVTEAYRNGAGETLKLARLFGCQCAVLKERSPSCGSGCIYDGTHSGKLTGGDGMTAELLKKNGIQVFGESKTEDLERFYRI